MEEVYYAVEINGEIFVKDIMDNAGTDLEFPHKTIGKVCTDECGTTCLHYRQGTCPCKRMKDVHGNTIHIFIPRSSNLI